MINLVRMHEENQRMQNHQLRSPQRLRSPRVTMVPPTNIDRQLPPNWTKHYSQTVDPFKPFYYNNVTNESQWNFPEYHIEANSFLEEYNDPEQPLDGGIRPVFRNNNGFLEDQTRAVFRNNNGFLKKPLLFRNESGVLGFTDKNGDFVPETDNYVLWNISKFKNR